MHTHTHTHTAQDKKCHEKATKTKREEVENSQLKQKTITKLKGEKRGRSTKTKGSKGSHTTQNNKAFQPKGAQTLNTNRPTGTETGIHGTCAPYKPATLLKRFKKRKLYQQDQ